jgi:DNA helicase-2/ATP-dependent DNA helicase PcrA
MGIFDDNYRQLNPAQKKAVDTIDGPVLVVAGPGTGKTQLLSMRVANILRTTDVDARNILCLTFTNKAATNMRDRLIKLTDGSGQNVMVKTFHSFAAEIMNMYPNDFWNGAQLTTAPDVIQNEVITGILKTLPLDDPLALKFAGNFTQVGDIKTALRLAKEAGLTPGKLKALASANIAFIDTIEAEVVSAFSRTLSAKKLDDLQSKIKTLPRQGIDASLAPLSNLDEVIQERLLFAITEDQKISKTTHTGKLKRDLIQTVDGTKGMFKERERNEWWESLANVYELYRSELHSRGYYDYSDMIVEVILTIEQNANVRADIQEQFQYVLIDEFQDTNAAQMRLAHLVADHTANNGKPNLMAVGDDDQSIYKFNGAELANMLMFQKSYPDCKVIVLQDNYRSSQAVLDTAKNIINQASDRLVLRDPSLSKEIKAVNEPSKPGKIIHLQYSDQDQQLYDISLRVKALYAKNKCSVAILARNNESLRRVTALLHQAEVPVSFSEQHNILQNEVVQLTYNLGSLVLAIQSGNQELTNQNLSVILRHPAWSVSAETLWELATVNRRGGNWLKSLLTHNNESLKQIGNWLQWLASKADTENAIVMVDYLLGLRASEHLTSPLREYFSTKANISTHYVQSLSAIRGLLGQVREYGSKQEPTLQNFINYINASLESNVVLGDESSFVTGNRAVELLTVHKAKGLEFDTVFVIDVIDQNWSPSKRGKKAPLNLPLQPAFDDMDDYIRLLYVAATRAKRNLIFTSFTHDYLGNDILSSPLLLPVPTQQISVVKEESVPTLETALEWPRLDHNIEQRNLSAVLENFSLSATALLDFLDVSRGGPSRFLERHLLCLPQTTSTAMAFGTAIHAALEYAQILTNRENFKLDPVIERFTKSLQEQFLPHQEFERFNQHGRNLLEKLLQSDTFWLPKGGIPEQKISDVRIGNARLTGKIDRIELRKEKIIIADYKTGTPLSSFTTKDQTKAIKAWRHRMQLTFYTLLVKQSRRIQSDLPIVGQMLYVESSQPKELVREYEPSLEDLHHMQRLITAIWPKIQKLELPSTDDYDPGIQGILAFEHDLLSDKK